jgi:hypothetical protein
MDDRETVPLMTASGRRSAVMLSPLVMSQASSSSNTTSRLLSKTPLSGRSQGLLSTSPAPSSSSSSPCGTFAISQPTPAPAQSPILLSSLPSSLTAVQPTPAVGPHETSTSGTRPDRDYRQRGISSSGECLGWVTSRPISRQHCLRLSPPHRV